MIVMGGIVYLVSAGNQNLIALAKKAIFSALAGFALVLLAWVFVNTVIVYLLPVSEENDIGVKVNGWSNYSCDSTTGGPGGGTDPDDPDDPDPDDPDPNDPDPNDPDPNDPDPDEAKDTIYFTKAQITTNEEDEEEITIEVKRLPATESPAEEVKVSIEHDSTKGSATQSTDYEFETTSLEWSGKSDTDTKEIALTINNDDEEEEQENLFLTISPDTPGADELITESEVEIIVEDDDVVAMADCDLVAGSENSKLAIVVYRADNTTLGLSCSGGGWNDVSDDIDAFKEAVSENGSYVVGQTSDLSYPFSVYRYDGINDPSSCVAEVQSKASVVMQHSVLKGGASVAIGMVGGLTSESCMDALGAYPEVVTHEAVGHGLAWLSDEYTQAGGGVLKNMKNYNCTKSSGCEKWMPTSQGGGNPNLTTSFVYGCTQGCGDASWYRATSNPSIMNAVSPGSNLSFSSLQKYIVDAYMKNKVDGIPIDSAINPHMEESYP
jgi:hypothetical protein